MVSIIKNQLLKHLSRFTKNLSADKINLSTLRGEGELTNLELDEAVLTDLLELPSWLKLTSAWCNKVNLRVQWTKLKSVPIFLHLDEVHIELVTCEELRSPTSPNNATAFPGATKYSFIHKVIDGITIAVNTVTVTFRSPAFIANVQIARITVESKSPAWQRCDLRMTRLKDTDRGQLLIFKEMEWQTVRIEAQSTKDKDLTPLRLLTNQARCRITIKKRLSDCFVLGSRLVLILDDLLWVLTDSQLKAALRFIDSLGGLIERATMLERKVKAARKLELLPEYQAQVSQQARSKIQCNTAISKIFMRYDVVETCYHFLCQRIDLHLCDDPGPGRSSHPDLQDGGALQISLVKFQIDYYPYHLAMADRKHWAKYKENATPHAQWLQQSLNAFRGQFMDLIDIGQSHGPSKRVSTDHSDEKKQGWEEKRKSMDQQSSLISSETKKTQPSGNVVKNFVLEQLSTLMTTCIVIRINDFTVYKVTTSTRKPTTKEFITGDRDKFCLPDDVTIIHAEFTYYYYPGDISFPLPPPKFYVQANPLQINYDVFSCLWFNSFVLNLYQSLLSAENHTEDTDVMYFDVKLEAILPRIVLETQHDYPNQRDRPKSLHLQISRVSVTNVRSTERSSRADLAECLNAFQMGQMFYSSEFPSKDTDFRVIPEKFLSHCAGTDNVRSYPPNFNASTIEELTKQLTKKLLWIDSKDMWCCSLEPVWADFFGARAVGSNRPVPFLDAFPVTIWLHLSPPSPSSATSKSIGANIHGLAYISNLISVQLNHYQYLFLLRQLESLTEMSTYLGVDSNRILNVESGSLTIGALIPQVEVTLIMPSQTPGKENSGGDLESVVPDSSSIAEDLLPTSLPHPLATAARMEFGSKRLNTSNDVETPQSEVCSMILSEHPTQQVVTFKQERPDSIQELDFPRLKRQPSETTPFIPNNFNVGLSSMKKGFANLMTSIDSALKASPEDGSSDTVSMRSDMSSDSENYVADKLEEGDSFFGGLNVTGITTVEEATEVVEETPDTQSEKSMDSACKRKDLVSMITFKLSKVEVIQQSSGFDSVIKVQVAKIASEECSSIPWDEFQSKFSSRSRGWVEVFSDADCGACARIRLSHGLREENVDTLGRKGSHLHSKEGLMAMFQDELKARIMNVNLALSMSYVAGLTDLVEDEIIPDPLPMEIFLENISLRLNEDRPPNNITSPGPIPIDVVISNLKILRDKKGIFHVEPQSDKRLLANLTNGIDKCTISDETEIELNFLRQSSSQLKGDNEELKRRLAALEKLSEENSRLRRSHQELEILKSSLNGAQDYISELLKEKQALQDTVTVLQKQLTKSNESANSGRPSWSIKR
ncbi:UHRF1-binding protein 1-like [Fopius arisanus]|uniref:UHRF1-binding protein 1-like n=1 Tax=Fopius arisanus TaxID=64838 RepID=A0A0C9RKV9_9HYME|nr:PREDICTED: UHRF1-binding protein 1-like [Fopius arisanus]